MSQQGNGSPMGSGNGADRAVPTLPPFNARQERSIHQAASEVVAAAVTRRGAKLSDPNLDGAAEQEVMGAFVSLKRKGRLRACCGNYGGSVPVSEAIRNAATATATSDHRFPAVSPTELKYLDLEVWLLAGFRPVTSKGEQRVSEVVIGKHGLQIRRGKSHGLLLPGVAVEHGVDAEGFLQMVCEKAQLPPTAWKEDDVQLFTFDGRSIAGHFDQSAADGAAAATTTFLAQADVKKLAAHGRDNATAVALGTIPSAYSMGIAEGTVHALALTLRMAGRQEAPRFSKLSLRPGLPLQATLASLVEEGARTLFPQGANAQTLNGLQADVTALWDPAMHGTVEDPDLQGIDSATRALMVMEGSKMAWAYDPQQSAETLLKTASREAQVRVPANAIVLSLAAASTEASISTAYLPRPQVGPSTRPAAVAGTFYPGEAGELSRMVDGLVAGSNGRRERWPAVMVPHAGLKYSGKLAADVYRRVEIPDVVLIVAPRHRPEGMDWAVAPHETWSLPGITVASDPDLARALAKGVPDLHLDAVAHKQEHSIEVQLPLLARVAPHARVVGIAVGAGDLNRCREFAKGLADVLGGLDTKPLLVISSDLNHFATDAENRRLDEMAITSLERLDAGDLYDTINKNKISMCGRLPALIVLETLKQLGSLNKCERVGYATSADVSGDKSRVVGYAGMLFG